MITFLIEILQLWPYVTVITFILKYLYFNLGRLRVANFADIIKIATMFIKTTFKDSKKLKRIRNYVLKCNLYLYFLI